MPTEAEYRMLQDEALKHGTYLSRFAAGLGRRQSEKLREALYGRLHDRVAAALARVRSRGPEVGPQTRRGLRDALGRIRVSLHLVLEEIERDTRSELQGLAREEAENETALLLAIFGAGIAVAVRSNLRRSVREAAFAGETVRDHFRIFEWNLHEGLQREIRSGLASGERLERILNRLTGSKGLYERATTSLAARAGTLATGVAAQAREEVYEKSPAVARVMWVSTLDGRTCLRCASLHGSVFDVGTGPRPPLHTNCRCMTTPAGSRDVVAIDFGQWLHDQPLTTQNEILGRTRAQLFREERLELSRFVAGNRVLTLEELAKRRFPNTPSVFR